MQFVFDTKIPFGLWTEVMAAQRITNAIMPIYRNMVFSGVNCIDDIGSAETDKHADSGYQNLKTLINDLDFKVAE